MLNLNSLKNAINQLLADAESKRKLVDSLMKTAEQHEASGDDARAQLDRNSAERYLRDIDSIESTIAGYESEIMNREQKAKEIEKRIDDLNEHYKHDLERLESDKRSIRLDVLAGSETAVMIDEVRNRRIDKKEEELQKQYNHDLQKLIDEQKLVLG